MSVKFLTCKTLKTNDLLIVQITLLLVRYPSTFLLLLVITSYILARGFTYFGKPWLVNNFSQYKYLVIQQLKTIIVIALLNTHNGCEIRPSQKLLPPQHVQQPDIRGGSPDVRYHTGISRGCQHRHYFHWADDHTRLVLIFVFFLLVLSVFLGLSKQMFCY